MLKKHLLIFMTCILILGSLVVAGCSSSTVATVNGEKITQGMVDQQVKSYIADYEYQYKSTFDKDKSKLLYQKFQNNAERDLIRQTLLLQEAQKRKLSVSDAEVDNSIKAAKTILGTDKKNNGYEKYLKTLNMTEAEFKDSLKKQILAGKVKNEVTKDISISDTEAADYYAKHKANYNKLLPEIMDKVKKDALKAKKEQVWLDFGAKLQQSSKIETK